MSYQIPNAAAGNLQSLFSPQDGQGLLKKWAGMNARMTSLFVKAGNQSVDIMSNTSKEALSNLREVTQVRDEPAAYGKAYSDFVQKQMDLLQRTAQDMGELTRKTGSESAEMASRAGEDLNDEVTANVEAATNKATAYTKDATDKATAYTKDATDKAGSDFKKSA
ncbi:phasin family protein [uncultured Jannaschia sp.]|uniref:phasin family protein n=1 Tax=uncultured Jannaschia sp. TaxID=293347 RepID=UPI002639232C|nr:phasin family protein [uncultured Jannaschia sp.]